MLLLRRNKQRKSLTTNVTSRNSKAQLDQLINQLKKQNSFVYQFALSIVKGFGNMIGASIVFGLLGLWLKANLQGIIVWIKGSIFK